ncbi:MAG: hypothetical protein ACLFPD_10360 [Desulfosudaceae bacterium]
MSQNAWSRCFTAVTGLLLILALALPGAAGAKSLTISAVGTASVDGEDTAAAKNAAIGNALAAAADAALQQLVPADVLTDNFERIDALFFEKSEKYVSNYVVQAVYRQKNRCRALVKADIDGTEMEKRVTRAGILMDLSARPKVLIRISRKTPDDAEGAPRAETAGSAGAAARAMADNFRSRGFVILDDSGRGPAPDTAPDDILDAARQAGADFMISGEITLSPGGQSAGGEPASWSARGMVRALAVESGRQVAETDTDSRQPSGEEISSARKALAAAGTAAADRLAPALVSAFSQVSGRSRNVEIIVRGDDYLGALNRLNRQMENMEMVTAFQLKEMAVDQAIFSAACTGDSSELAAALEAADGPLAIQITDVTENRIIIRVTGSR